MNISARLILLLALGAGLLVVFDLLSPIMTPFFLGALFAYLGDPWVDRLEAWGLGRAFASALVFLLIAGLFTLLLVMLIPLLAQEWAPSHFGMAAGTANAFTDSVDRGPGGCA